MKELSLFSFLVLLSLREYLAFLYARMGACEGLCFGGHLHDHLGLILFPK